MKATITPIGNSRGIRIPAALLKQCALEKEVELTVRNGELIISAVRAPRHGWEASLAASKPEALLIDDALDLDDADWKW